METWEEHAIRRPHLPEHVTVYEVGPRDGLQNEAETLPVEVRVEFVDRLTEAGLPAIEVGSFVSPKAIPQLADTEELYRRIHRASGVRYPALVPNRPGARARAGGRGARDRGLHGGVRDLQPQEHQRRRRRVDRAVPARRRAREGGEGPRSRVRLDGVRLPLRGRRRARGGARGRPQAARSRVDEISVGDTIGVATPADVYDVIETLYESGVTRGVLALHFHDTRGTALANVYAALQCGVTTFDASAGGLGGCPYAPGASGNLATEDLLYLLEGLGIETGVTLPKVVEASRFLAERLGRRPPGRYLAAVWGESR